MQFDYIIVGGGTSGLTIAKLLSIKYNVLVLEAGRYITDDPKLNDSNNVLSLDYTKYCYQGQSIPQNNVNNRNFDWTGGRLLGGSSAINGEQYVRGSYDLYCDWSEIAGDIWSPEQVFPRYSELEKHLSIRKTPISLSKLNREIASKMYPIIDDYNNPSTPLGSFCSWDMTQQKDGSRETSLSPDLKQGTYCKQYIPNCLVGNQDPLLISLRS